MARTRMVMRRNDIRTDPAFRRWTVYLDGKAALDVEVSAVPGYPARLSAYEVDPETGRGVRPDVGSVGTAPKGSTLVVRRGR